MSTEDLKLTKFVVNGYTISWNSYWGFWEVWHPEIGRCEDFRSKKEAILYAEKG